MCDSIDQKKLNSFDRALSTRVWEAFLRFAEDPEVKAVVITGTGKYYTAGADFGEAPQLGLVLRPQSWRADVAEQNYRIFLPFITFAKPIVIAVNGPTIGMGVTTASLADYVVATPQATFCTPFAKVGVPPEGCSSINFERRFGKENAAVLLEQGATIDGATALRFGLVQEIVDPNELVERARQVALGLVGQERPVVRDGLVETFKATNWEESVRLANMTICSDFFLRNMQNVAARGKNDEAWVMWAMSKVVPVLDTIQSFTGAVTPRLQPELHGKLKSSL